MKTELERFVDRASRRLARRRLRDDRLPLRAAAHRPHPTRPGQGWPAQLRRRGDAGGPGGARLAPRARGPRPTRRCTAPARPLLRGAPARSTCRSDWQLSKGFRRRALHAIDHIPYGKTRSYTQIATSAGNERAVRAAGTACGSNPIPIIVPCHRVLRSGGGLGGYGGGLPMKEALLRMEGVERP